MAAAGAPLAFATDPCSHESDSWRNADSFSVRAAVSTNDGAAVTATADCETKTLDKDYQRIGGYQQIPGRNKDKEYTTTFKIDGVSGQFTCTARLKSNGDHDVKFVSNTCGSTNGYTVKCQRNYGSADETFTVKYTVDKP